MLWMQNTQVLVALRFQMHFLHLIFAANFCNQICNFYAQTLQLFDHYILKPQICTCNITTTYRTMYKYSKTPQSADFGTEQNCTADCEIRRLRVLLYVVNGTEWCITQC